MFTRINEEVLFVQSNPIKGKEPFLSFRNPQVTIQFQSGRKTHQFVFMVPMQVAATCAPGDSLDFRIIRKYTVKTRLGRLKDKLCGWF